MDESCVVTRSVTISDDLTWKAHVHGKEIAHSNPMLKNIREILDACSLRDLINTLDTVHVCCGNQEKEFVDLVEVRNGSINNNGVQSAYLDKTPHVPGDDTFQGTVRASNCDIITHTAQCTSCSGYRRNLRALVSRSKKITSPVKKKRLDMSSHTNYRYLRSPELRQRLQNSMSEVRTLNKRVSQLQEKLHKLTQSIGVNLDENMHSDMRAIVSENNITSEYPPDSFARIFWEQQSESMRKNPIQMRWHPMMVKWCIHLRMLSSSCYHSLRSSGVLKLPSERTLRDYTNVIKAKVGIPEGSG